MSNKHQSKSGSRSKRKRARSIKDNVARYALFSYVPVAMGAAAHEDAEGASHDDEGEREDFSVAKATREGEAARRPTDLDVVSISPILADKPFKFVGHGGPKRLLMWVGTIQPTTSPEPDGGGYMEFRGQALIAPPGRRAIIGGMPTTARAGCVEARILIEDSDVDVKIELGSNVQIGRKDRRVQVTHIKR